MDGNGMNPFSIDHEWLQQQYPNTAMAPSGGEPSHDPTTVFRDSNQGTDPGHVGPKPIRRRSRASRRTPTTVLNASPTDFRALVQRFTGCDSKNMASPSHVNLPRGPVNIDFARNDVNLSSSRYSYYDNQMIRPSLHAEQTQSEGSLSDLQSGYGVDNTSVLYESIDESSLMGTRIDIGRHGYNV